MRLANHFLRQAVEEANERREILSALIPPHFEDVIYEHFTRTNPVFDRFRPPPVRLTRRQRLRMRLYGIRARVADAIGGGHYYREGCDCD